MSTDSMLRRSVFPSRRIACSVLALGLTTAGLACAGTPKNSAEEALDQSVQSSLGVCEDPGNSVLVVDWDPSDRAALEAAVQRGPVVVKREGCVVERLPGCAVEGAPYSYLGLSPKRDAVSVRTKAELAATLPVGALQLSGEVEAAGGIFVSLSLAGVYEVDEAVYESMTTQGSCDGATHIVGSAQAGAFTLQKGAKGSASVNGTGKDVAIGTSSAAEKGVLDQDGDQAACESSANGDAAPPEGCGGIVRVELVPM